MRYRDGELPDQLYPYTEGTHHMLTASMWLGIVIGCALLFLGIHGKVLWLKFWSVGLIVVSTVYLVADAAGVF